jgi:hypothetical protein
MDPRWQPHLGAVQPATVSPEACDLLAAGWSAHAEECWVGGDAGQDPRMVSPETWHALRDRTGFVRPRLQLQQRGVN